MTLEGFYKNENCDWSFCSSCIFGKSQVFYFRGYCEDELKIDTEYMILKTSIERNVFEFIGLEGLTIIQFNEAKSTWQLIEKASNNVVSFLEKNIDHVTQGVLNKFPFGLREWSTIEYCNMKMDNYTKLKFLFSRVCINN